MSQSRFVCGLDFGTSNTCVATCGPQGTDKSSMVFVSFPSVCFFPEGKGYAPAIGNAAIDLYAKSNRRGRFFQSVKSVLADKSLESTNVFGEQYSVAQLVSLILKEGKDRIEAKTRNEIDTVVLGRPVLFVHSEDGDKLARERLLIAARLAGFRKVDFELEPVAAAFTYEQHLKQDQVVLVVDLGGGTADFSVMRLGPSRMLNSKDRRGDVLAVHGITLGGNDFDGRLLWEKGVAHFGYGALWGDAPRLSLPVHIFRDLCDWELFPFLNRNDLLTFLRSARVTCNKPLQVDSLINLIKSNAGYKLFRACEQTKIALNTYDQGKLTFGLDGDFWSETIAQEEFNGFCADLADRIAEGARQCIAGAGLSAGTLDRVFMTGGTSLLHVVRKRFENLFGVGKLATADMFSSVAEGLALIGRKRLGRPVKL